MTSSDPLRVLIVCTANQYRSVVAEFLLRELAMSVALNWQVSSAGTAAAGGRPMHPAVAAILAGRGGPTASWRSSRLGAAAVSTADLVLCAERSHRAAAVEMVPRAARRAFTLRQFAGLLVHATLPERPTGARIIVAALAARGCRIRGRPEDDDIADPAGRGAVHLADCVAEIDATLRSIVTCASGRDFLPVDAPPAAGPPRRDRG